MITSIYAHILDEDRKINVQKFERAFYSGPDLQDVKPPQEQELSVDLAVLIEQLQKLSELAGTLVFLLAIPKLQKPKISKILVSISKPLKIVSILLAHKRAAMYKYIH